MTIALYRRILGPAFEQMPPSLQTFHDITRAKVFTAQFKITRAEGWIRNLACRFGGLPAAGEDVPMRLRIIPDGDGEIWEREFGSQRLTDAMQAKSIEALRDLNGYRHAEIKDPEINSRIAAYELAFRMQSAAPELIALKDETKKTLDEYGVEREDTDLKGGRGGGKGTFHQFALNCLLARRLVERGVRFVNLYHASWDHHSNLDAELQHNCRMADQPVAALIKDLKQRKLLDSTLVLWLSEFGRTPLGENRGGSTNVTGRDHHPFAFTIWMAGGGVKGGTILGKTDDIGWNVVEDKVHVNDLHATILHLFGLDHLKLTYRFQGRDFRLTDVAGKVVKKLLA